jgi:hypothetical protein
LNPDRVCIRKSFGGKGLVARTLAVSVGDFRDKLGNEATAGRINPVKMARPPPIRIPRFPEILDRRFLCLGWLSIRVHSQCS